MDTDACSVASALETVIYKSPSSPVQISTKSLSEAISSAVGNSGFFINNKYLPDLIFFMSHIIATSVAVILFSPVQVVKVRMQSSTHSFGRTVDRILRKEGFQGLWSGIRVGLIQSIPNSVLYMTIYEYLKLKMETAYQQTESEVKIFPAIAGATSRLTVVTLLAPLEIIRTKQSNGLNVSISGIASKIYRTSGWTGFYVGWWSTVLRDAPFSALYWYNFESMRSILHSNLRFWIHPDGASARHDTDKVSYRDKNSGGSTTFSSIINFTSSVYASAIAATVTHPYDVVKTRQQTLSEAIVSPTYDISKYCNRGMKTGISCRHGHTCTLETYSSASSAAYPYIPRPFSAPARLLPSTSTPPPPPPTSGIPRITLSSLYAEGGVRLLYQGFSMRLLSIIPSSAVMVTIYEAVKTHLQQ